MFESVGRCVLGTWGLAEDSWEGTEGSASLGLFDGTPIPVLPPVDHVWSECVSKLDITEFGVLSRSLHRGTRSYLDQSFRISEPWLPPCHGACLVCNSSIGGPRIPKETGFLKQTRKTTIKSFGATGS